MKRQVCKCSRDPSSFATSSATVDRSKPTDKESGFESSPSSPRACSSLEPGQQCLYGSQTELRHQRCTPANECVSLDSFKFIKKLGSGGYGSVVLVEKRRGRDRGALYALKITNLNRAALVERDILPRLQNVPYTTDLAYAFFNASLPKAFLALPYAVGKDLFSLVGPSRTPGYLRRMFIHNYTRYVGRMRIVLAELSVALRFLHKNNILYRDLKLENILVFGDGHLRLADFGLSRHFEGSESTLIMGKTGTPDYMAPEVLRSGGAHGPPTSYSFEADLWGLGVIAYELIVGQLPFKGREVADLELAILHDPIELPAGYMEEKFGVLLSHEKRAVLGALSLIRGLLQRHPENRLNTEDIPFHPFFQELDWEAVNSGRHGDPPFDIHRIVREAPPDDEIQRIPSAFTGLPSSKRPKKDKTTSPSGYDNPSKYRNYHYCGGQFGWYPSSLDGLRCHNSYPDLPANVAVDDDDLDGSGESGTLIDDVPGLTEFERECVDCSFASAGSSASNISSSSLFAVCSDTDSSTKEGCIAPPAKTASIMNAVGDAEESFESVSTVIRGRRRPSVELASPTASPSLRRRNPRIAATPCSPERPPGDESYSPASPVAPSQPRIELFPRVRVVNGAVTPTPRRIDFDATPPTPSRRLPRRVRASTPVNSRAPPPPLPPIAEECSPPTTRLRKRRAAAAPPAAAEVGVPELQLPPRKRKRFLEERLPSQDELTGAEPRVIVQAAGHTLPSFNSLRARTRAAAANNASGQR